MNNDYYMKDRHLANEIFLKEIDNFPNLKKQLEESAEISGITLIENASRLFGAWGFKVSCELRNRFCEFSDGEICITIGIKNGKFYGLYGQTELEFGKHVNRKLVFDGYYWMGPLFLGKRSQELRDLSKEGAPVVRLSALEVITQLIIDEFIQARHPGW